MKGTPPLPHSPPPPHTHTQKNLVQKKKKKLKATCFALRLSCATPLLAPAAGALGVGVSSALAGQASLRARRNLKSDDAAGTPVPRQWRRADVLCDAAVGVLLFRAMGGRFRSLLPSDLVSLVFFSSSLSLSCFFWEEEKLLQSKEGERKGKTDSLSRTRLTKNIFLFHPTFFSPPGETGRLRR